MKRVVVPILIVALLAAFFAVGCVEEGQMSKSSRPMRM
jgi:hypothetical protein